MSLTIEDLIKYHHINPAYDSMKDTINTQIKEHPLYLDGMEFKGAWYKPDRTGTDFHLELLSEWTQEEVMKAKRVYSDVLKASGIALTTLS